MSQKQETVVGVGILVAAFPDEQAGEQTLKTLKEAKELKYVQFEDVAVIRQDAEGDVHYHETGDMSSGKGAGIGALIGGVIGILGGPIGIAAGAGAGAAIGAAAAHGDAGFSDDSLEQLGGALKPGTSAIALTTSDKFLHVVHKNTSDDDVRTAVSDISAQLVTQIEEGKNIALGIVLDEEGLAITEVACGKKYTEVISIIAAKDGVIGDTTIAKEVERWIVPSVMDGARTSDIGGVTREGNLPG